MEPSDQSSNEEFSMIRRTAERRAQMNTVILPMREYNSYFISLCCLVIGLICAIGALVTSLYPSSLETNVILYEHR